MRRKRPKTRRRYTTAAPAFAAPKFRSRQSSSCVVCVRERERERERERVAYKSVWCPLSRTCRLVRNSRYSKKARRESILQKCANRFTCRSSSSQKLQRGRLPDPIAQRASLPVHVHAKTFFRFIIGRARRFVALLLLLLLLLLMMLLLCREKMMMMIAVRERVVLCLFERSPLFFLSLVLNPKHMNKKDFVLQGKN